MNLLTETNYPWENDRDYLALIDDIKDHEFITDLGLFRQHIYGNRLVHSYSVSYYSYKIAKRLNLDYRSVARAGLMHDLFYYDTKEMTFSKGNHFTNHPYIALKNAEVLTDLNEVEHDIIIKHMWLATWQLPAYPESFVVTFVDKYLASTEYLKPASKIWRDNCHTFCSQRILNPLNQAFNERLLMPFNRLRRKYFPKLAENNKKN
ncbi:phosphohydrolase [Aerococcus urinae]|uniref:HD domain-containing protein n=1 Tax=Aerococcus mictus TaxID=2976810 RepID=A0A1E9PA87_9LACT|nr:MULTISPECIES: HD domain-containing protein [Aerococcus]KAA9291849.1 phosphohydrolase [Aerococcus mictus]MBU5610060.1 phosphohydrolase [Aerococcus urinae]MCY3034779.1 phosphohydrolase [Aerococcus mictus]MCY3064113.1 phosphohydrolase [Aerococcus mictus]MCY3064864.1 phosphohydrolase [Aerococcus mictus]